MSGLPRPPHPHTTTPPNGIHQRSFQSANPSRDASCGEALAYHLAPSSDKRSSPGVAPRRPLHLWPRCHVHSLSPPVRPLQREEKATAASISTALPAIGHTHVSQLSAKSCAWQSAARALQCLERAAGVTAPLGVSKHACPLHGSRMRLLHTLLCLPLAPLTRPSAGPPRPSLQSRVWQSLSGVWNI